MILKKSKFLTNIQHILLFFFDNRKFIFIKTEQGSISYRLIEDNLPIFLKNINIFQQLLETDLANEKAFKANYDLFIDYTKFNNVLTQENIDKYNTILGGLSDSEGNKYQGLNELINLYNQKHKTKLPLLKSLYKQILSDKKSSSSVFEVIEKDNDIFQLIDNYLKENKFINYFSNKEININKIYITNKNNLSDLSQQIFDYWNEIPLAINKWYEENIDTKTQNKKFKEKRGKYLKNKKQFSISELNKLKLEGVNFTEKIKNIIDEQINLIYKNIICYNKIDKDNINNLKTNKMAKKVIKDLLDSILNHERFLRQFVLENVHLEKDSVFYNEFDLNYSKLKEINSIYNRIRNHITKKPFDTSKIKINFGKATLLDGWDLNKEKDCLGVIFRKSDSEILKYKYYLGILNDNKIFEDIEECQNNTYFEKMEYKLFNLPHSQLPRIFIDASKYKEKLSKEFLDKYNRGKHKKENLDKKFLNEYITYMIEKLNERYSDVFDFSFKKPADYNSVDEFYREVEEQGYSVGFKKIDANFINKCIEEDKLYLFEIYSKDFSRYSKGLPNNQTIYFRSLFSAENLSNNNFKLNGKAEIFYRRKSLEREITHKANEKIKNKNKDNKKKYSTFDYDLIKDRRYTENKFLFHFSITLNFKSANIKNINQIINKDIEKFKYIIGIDRGERNLIYLVVIDLKGNIVEQMSLNKIINEYKGNTYKTDYYHLLNERSAIMLKEKRSWEQIDSIKELKEGYISQVVNKIKELVFKYNAIIVLENLNLGFKNSRKKIDTQIYQKFETQLIKKFNYILNKNNPETYLNGIQLTNPFTTLDKTNSQTGIIFYIPAWNTSNIDPTTGFVNLLYKTKYKNIRDSKEIINKIKNIRFNGDYYEFDIDFNDFNPEYKETKTYWTICTYGTRIKNKLLEKSKGWESIEYDLTKEFNSLFLKYNINSNYKEEIMKLEEPRFFEQFLFLFHLTLQIRNSKINSDIDYILSPVKNRDNKFFDSREQICNLPKDADANGAYNIARKGLILYNRIKIKKQNKKIDYKIKNAEYLKTLQN